MERAAAKSLFSGEGHYHLLDFTGIQLQPGGCEFLHSLVQRMSTSDNSTQLCGRPVEIVRRADMLLTRIVSALGEKVQNPGDEMVIQSEVLVEPLHHIVGLQSAKAEKKRKSG